MRNVANAKQGTQHNWMLKMFPIITTSEDKVLSESKPGKGDHITWSATRLKTTHSHSTGEVISGCLLCLCALFICAHRLQPSICTCCSTVILVGAVDKSANSTREVNQTSLSTLSTMPFVYYLCLILASYFYLSSQCANFMLHGGTDQQASQWDWKPQCYKCQDVRHQSGLNCGGLQWCVQEQVRWYKDEKMRPFGCYTVAFSCTQNGFGLFIGSQAKEKIGTHLTPQGPFTISVNPLHLWLQIQLPSPATCRSSRMTLQVSAASSRGRRLSTGASWLLH